MFSAWKHVTELVDDRVHGVLNGDEAHRVDEHCESCEECREALEAAQRRLELLQSLPGVEASSDLLARTERFLDERSAAAASAQVASVSPNVAAARDLEKEQGRRLRVAVRVTVGVFAVGAVLLFAGEFYFKSLRPSPWVIQVLGQRQLLPGSEAAIRVMVFNRDTRQPLAGTQVKVRLAGHELIEFETDENGTGSPRFRIPDSVQSRDLRISAQTPHGLHRVEHTIEVQRTWRLMLNTDKPVYQPGQTIHMRSLALADPSMKPLPDRPVEFRILDPRGNVVFQHEAEGSRFGIASADCPLADELIEGSYQIECRLDESRTTSRVEVRRYVLPKFKLNVKLDRSIVEPGGLITGKVEADYFFAKPVDAGQGFVELFEAEDTDDVLRMARFKTNGDGTATFQLRAPLNGAADHDVKLRISVTDSAGQQESKELPVVVTLQPLSLKVVPEFEQLVRGAPARVFLFATYADGRSAAETRIRIPGLRFDGLTDANGIAVAEFQARNSMTLDATLEDRNGLKVRTSVSLNCRYDPEAFVLRTDRAVYRAGDTLKLQAWSSEAGPVFVDVLQGEQTILTTAIGIRDGTGARQIDLPSEVSGPLELCAYRLASDGLPARITQRVHVAGTEELRVRIEADRPEYQPGGTARLKIRLSDADGTARPGAVSLAAVDQAVFSVLGQESSAVAPPRSGYETLPPMLASTVWTPATSPDQVRYQQAMFAQAVQTVRPPEGTLDVEQLLPYLDNDPRVLEVLKRPDWKTMVADWMPPEHLALLEPGDRMHSLEARSAPSDQAEVEQRKTRGLRQVQRGWAGLWTVTVFLGVLGFLWALSDRFFTYFVSLVLICFLIALLLPAVQNAREAARRTMARNDLKQIDIALHNFRDATGNLPVAAAVAAAESPVRVRSWFPETLLWEPNLITNDQGEVSLDVPLADSITDWKVTASGITADGELGNAESSLRVFQPLFVDLNLPVSFTRGDTVSLPVVVYNYGKTPQEVTVTLAEDEWFELLDEAVKTRTLEPGDVKSVYFRVRMPRAGEHEFEVTARADNAADAVRRSVRVLPGGRPIERVVNGNLAESALVALHVPDEFIEGSLSATLRIYPSTLSETLDGVESLLRAPHGCFEQTSSSTYPNVLVLEYVSREDLRRPGVEARARQLVQKGYQRLLGFEVAGGGFEWFGRDPASRTLTAYGLMEFKDMARVHPVDPALIDRTRRWLLDQRLDDGTWSPDRGPHDLQTSGGSARLRTTAYIAWAVLNETTLTPGPTMTWLLKHNPETITDPYEVALVANALLAMKAPTDRVRPWLVRLMELRTSEADGKRVFWKSGETARTVFYGQGPSSQIEATALAVLALSRGCHFGALSLPQEFHRAIPAALAWISSQRDPRGGWHTTQATILALKAFLSSTDASRVIKADREVIVAVNGKQVETIRLSKDTPELVGQIDLAKHLTSGDQQLRLESPETGAAPGFQLVFRYHVEDKPAADPANSSLSVDVAWSRNDIPLHETVRLNASVSNHGTQTVPMTMVTLPVPPGFQVSGGGFEQLVEDQAIARYEVTAEDVVLYLRQLEPGKPFRVNCSMRPMLRVQTTARAATVWEYYNPQNRSRSGVEILRVTPDSGGGF